MRRAVAVHAAAQPAPKPPPSRDLPPIDRILQGAWQETPHGPAFIRDEWFAFDHLHGTLPLSAPLRACPDALALLCGAEAPEPGRLAFFDIETTGLAGGTGTYIVLAGLGTFEEHGFRLRQYFLADIAGECAMLSLLAEDLARCRGIVTYNGRAFDVPCLETRMALSRQQHTCRDLPHFDLLHAVRRLYKHRMPGCKLAEAERRLLRIERHDDLPGRLIPALYFDYVRAGRAAPLRPVFRHNADDVLSLVGLLAALARLLTVNEPLDPEDAVAVARWWELARRPERALPLYREALPWLEGGDDWAWAAGRYARLCRRAGARHEAVAHWLKLWGQGDAAAGLELAKHLEHRERDFDSAAAITRELLAAGNDPAFEHRLTRLTVKARRLAAHV